MSDENAPPTPERPMSYSEKYAGQFPQYETAPQPLSPYGIPPQTPRRRAGLVVVAAAVALVVLGVAGVAGALLLKPAHKASTATAHQPTLVRPTHAVAPTHHHPKKPKRHHPHPTIATATGTLVENHQAGVSLRLPDGWHGASLENGVPAALHELIGDNSAVESRLEVAFAALSGSGVMLGLDLNPSDITNGVGPNVEVIADPTVAGDYGLHQAADAEAAGVANLFKITDRRTLDLNGTPAERIDYTNIAGNIVGAAYVVKASSGTVYAIIFTFGSSYSHPDDVADASVATFTAG